MSMMSELREGSHRKESESEEKSLKLMRAPAVAQMRVMLPLHLIQRMAKRSFSLMKMELFLKRPEI